MSSSTPGIKPELIVAGAGPGDPELISIKALKALQQADVVLYDNLINKTLLEHTRTDCEKIYVGKQPYGDYTPQETIHALILEKATTKGKVVRLKGGDPYIFGRGYEEILFARQHGIEASYIPGITSMQAVGLDDIPLTYRTISESIWILTGTKKDGSLSGDLKKAMHSKATVVIYMGVKKLRDIAAIYEGEQQGHMPAAIIQYASLPNRKLIKGMIKDLPALVEAQQLTHPAVLVIGPVAGEGMNRE